MAKNKVCYDARLNTLCFGEKQFVPLGRDIIKMKHSCIITLGLYTVCWFSLVVNHLTFEIHVPFIRYNLTYVQFFLLHIFIEKKCIQNFDSKS